MVEMLGVLAIIGVLSVGGIAGYSKAMEKHKINKAIDQISMIVANVETMFSNTNNYTGLFSAYDLKIFPDDMKYVNDFLVRNTFGLYTKIMGRVNYWTLRYDVPGRSACIAILTQNWPSAYKIGAAVRNETDESENDSTAAANAVDTPISISQAGEFCEEDVNTTILIDFH